MGGSGGVQGDDQVAGFEEWHLYAAFVVDPGQALLRIDRYLTNRLEHASRAFVQRAIERGLVHVGGHPVRSSYRVRPGDRVDVYGLGSAHAGEILPEAIPLDVVYEDEYMLVVNKPAGMVVHPGHGHFSGTLVNALLHHLRGVPLFQAGGVRPGLAHRIDKDTSGLLAVGKTDGAMSRLSAQFATKAAARAYTALVWGRMPQGEGCVESYLGRDPSDRQRMRASGDPAQGKHAVTHWRLLEGLHYTSLLECRLETGRMHQIRVHMQSIGRPIFNDGRYGGDAILRGVDGAEYRAFVHEAFRLCPRQALHAHELRLAHPHTGEAMRFDAPLPGDMASLLQHLRGWS